MYQILIRSGNVLFQVMSMLILANVIFSWIRPNRDKPIIKFVYSVTEPILEPIRKVTRAKTIDFSPFVAILLIDLILHPFYEYVIGLMFL